MYLIKIEENTDPDYKLLSTDVKFKSKWEAECFVYDMTVKVSERENDRMLFKAALAFFIFLSTFVTCVIYSSTQDLHKLVLKE